MISPLPNILSKLRFRQLQLLIAIDNLGSLHQAAEFVAISQPGATKSLNEIEHTFGEKLFERSSTGLKANELGQCVIRYARLISSDMANLREEMLDIMAGQGGRVKIGSIMGGLPLLIAAVAKLNQSHPMLSIEIVEDTSARLLELLQQGKLDLALCRNLINIQPENFFCFMSCNEPVCLVANSQHPLANQTTLTLAELQTTRWITYPVGLPLRKMLEHEFHQAGIDMPRRMIETSSTFATLSLLKQDPRLVTLMPTQVFESIQPNHDLIQLPLNLTSTNPSYGVYSLNQHSLSPFAQLLLNELLEALTESEQSR